MVARRLLIVLAVLLGLTALAAGVAPRPNLDPDPGAVPPGNPAPAQARGRVARTLDAGATGQHVVAKVGQTVVLTVRSSVLRTVSLAEVGVRTAEADSPAHWEIFADVPGSYALALQDSDTQIGTIEVRPAA